VTFISVLPFLLFGAMAMVMFGLGLSLSTHDFSLCLKQPKAMLIALTLQVLILPLLCWGMVVAWDVAPVFSVGLMLLAASPGGVSANLFSHLFGGNVAMNISLTAINTLLSVVSLPFIANWAIDAFMQTGQNVPMQTSKVIEVMGIVLIPVLIGMLVRHKNPAFSTRMEKPMKRMSIGVLAIFALIAIIKEKNALSASVADVGLAVLAFNAVSLLSGYYVSRACGLAKPLATSICFEIGIHNSTLAIYVALSVLNNFQLALPAALYSVSMYIMAALFGKVALSRYR
jgi:bile acid:Na+ symporter, BASS family